MNRIDAKCAQVAEQTLGPAHGEAYIVRWTLAQDPTQCTYLGDNGVWTVHREQAGAFSRDEAERNAAAINAQPTDYPGTAEVLPAMPARERLFVSIIRGGQHYVFLYTPATARDVIRVFARFAADPELAFTWHDAATLTKRVKESHDFTTWEGWPLP